MHEQDKAIVQGLVSVAWADGVFEDRERELLDALTEQLGANEAETAELVAYAAEKKSLADIPLNELSFGDRRTLMSHAVALSWIDGSQADSEAAFLEKLRAALHITEEEFADISGASTQRAKDLLALLAADEAEEAAKS